MIHSIGTTLFELRKSRQLTQSQLCKQLNINRSSYSYYENNNRMPDLETAAILARFYGITIDELIHANWTIDLELENVLEHEKKADERMLQYLHQLGINCEALLSLNKSDFSFMESYKKLSPYDQSELRNAVDFKLQNKHIE